mmetsp:Transcript_2426/g.4769  ORF Transcript_2426/g.4769 Transcript_2426/m.4769 type:complete len:99 (-) Transcript_2426:161-457(-)
MRRQAPVELFGGLWKEKHDASRESGLVPFPSASGKTLRWCRNLMGASTFLEATFVQPRGLGVSAMKFLAMFGQVQTGDSLGSARRRAMEQAGLRRGKE